MHFIQNKNPIPDFRNGIEAGSFGSFMEIFPAQDNWLLLY
jgi:hypothetical protein